MAGPQIRGRRSPFRASIESKRHDILGSGQPQGKIKTSYKGNKKV